MLVFAAGGAPAQTTSAADENSARPGVLKQRLDEQTRRLDALKRALAEHEASLNEMRCSLGNEALAGQRGGTLNVSLGAGLTRDTPDVTLTVRMPISF